MREIKKIVMIGIILCICFVGMNQAFSNTNPTLQAQQMEEQSGIDNPLQSLEELYIPEELQSLVGQSMQKYEQKARSIGADDKINKPIQIVNPVLFIELQNEDGSYDEEWITDENLAKAEQLYNGSENSLRAYFKKISYGKLDIVSEFYPKNYAGKVTSVKSSFKKSFLEPKVGAAPFISGTQFDPIINYEENYDPSIGDTLSDQRSFRYHELYVYDDALNDVIEILGCTVAQQIGQDYESEAMYDQLNSRYSNVFDFSSWESEFSWSTIPQDGWTWPKLYRTNELVSADSFTFVLRASEEQVRSSNGQVSDVYWPHKYSWRSSGAPLPHLLDTMEGQKFLKTCSPIPGDGLCNLPFTAINNAATVYADNGSGLFSDESILGVITHEFMHVMDAPDLYRISYKGQAVGSWDLLGAQNNTMPQYPLQFTMEKYGLWATPEPETINSYASLENRSNVTVNAPIYSEGDQKTYYKIYPDTTDYVRHGEYFVVEYRKKASSGFDSQIPGSGLLVYRVNERISNTYRGAVCGLACGNMVGPPDEIFMFRPNATSASLSNQNGFDENLNHAAFPRTINSVKVNAIGKTLKQVPASSLPAKFDKDTLYFSDGSNSGLRIVNISDAGGDSMRFTVLYGEEEAIDTTLGLRGAQSSMITRTANNVSDNQLTISGGEAPYALRMEGVQKDGVDADTSLFTIEDSDTSDTTATLKLATGKTLDIGIYTINVKVSDAQSNSKTIAINYQVKPTYPTDMDKLTFQDYALPSSETAGSDALLGSLALDGCSENGCVVDYDCDAISYRIEFLGGKDYSEYFQIKPSLDGNSASLYAKKLIPAGTYPFKGILTFLDGEEEVELRKDNLELVVSADPEIIYPIVHAPSGSILTTSTWMKDTQVLTFRVEDGGSNLKKVSITTTDGTLVDSDMREKKQLVKEYAQVDKIASDTINFSIKANGTYTIQAVNWDDNNNQEAVTFTVDKLDCEKPHISLQVSDIEQKKMVTIHTDDLLNETTLSGVKLDTIKYTLLAKEADESAIVFDMTYSAPFEIEENFIGKLCAEVYDYSGNRAQTCSTIEKASDEVKPTLDISTIAYSPEGWTNQDITMSFVVEDNNSGVKSIKIESIDGELRDGSDIVKARVKSYDTPILKQEESFILAKNGTFVITYEDGVGNKDTTSITIKKLDKAQPIIDEFIILNEGLKTSINVSAKDMPNQVDEQSGVEQIYYQYVGKDAEVSSSAWKEYPDEVTQNWPNAASDDGSICIYVKDYAGNKSIESCKKIRSSDHIKPTIDSITGLKDINSDASGWSSAPFIEVSINASDAQSGVQSIIVRKDGIIVGTPFEAEEQITSINYKCNVESNGTYEIRVVDMEGNLESTSFIVNQFDRDAPVINYLEMKAPTLHSLVSPNRAMFVAHDLPVGKHSGVAYYKYQLIRKGESAPNMNLQDASWIRVNEGNDFEIPPDFEGTLYAYSFDKVTNQSALYTKKIENAQEETKDISLKTLTISSGVLSPNFDKAVLTYRTSVENDVDSILITATASDPSASVVGAGSKSLKVGENVIRIVVKKGSEQKTYTLNIIRKEATPSIKSKDANLKNLHVNKGHLSPEFDMNKQSYQLDLKNEVESVRIMATANHDKAILSGDVDKDIKLKVGKTSLHINVLAEDGTTKTYTILVNREEQIIVNKKIEISNTDQTIKAFGEFDETLQLFTKVIQKDEVQVAETFYDDFILEEVYDIYLMKEDGSKYEISSDVKVQIALKDEWKGKKDLSIVYIGDDGSVSYMPTTIYDDYVEFTTDHFSKYGIVFTKDEVVDVQTGDDSQRMMFLSIIVIAGFSLCITIRKNSSVHEI